MGGMGIETRMDGQMGETITDGRKTCGREMGRHYR